MFDNCVCRISLSTDKYHIIRAPIDLTRKYHDLHVGKSKKGVYLASLDDRFCLQVWRLKDASPRMEWVLIYLKRMVPCPNYDQGSWILQGINYNDDHEKSVVHSNKITGEALKGENLEWNSDDDDVVTHGSTNMSIVGFHPYKEVIFLCESTTRVVAYHLNGSKVQYLGNIPPQPHDAPDSIRLSFPYTPCWM